MYAPSSIGGAISLMHRPREREREMTDGSSVAVVKRMVLGERGDDDDELRPSLKVSLMLQRTATLATYAHTARTEETIYVRDDIR
jgi:hypothetical protein